MKRILLIIAVLLGVVSNAPAAHADDIECTGPIIEGTVDNVIVPAGAFCFLYSTHVNGNVDVQENATLVSACATIDGDVVADGAESVILNCSTIGGRVQVIRGGEGRLLDSAVTGDVLFARNSEAVGVNGNVIGGSVQALRNRGGVTIRDNGIGNDLRCSRNNPGPTGANNEVGGTKSGQCRGLLRGVSIP
jgi:hypothetical protein